MKVKYLIKLETIVTEILEENELARSDDYILYLAVCEKLCPNAMSKSLEYVLKNHNEVLPNWESVTRARRKVQERREDLISERAKKKREKEQAAYVEYAHT